MSRKKNNIKKSWLSALGSLGSPFVHLFRSLKKEKISPRMESARRKVLKLKKLRSFLGLSSLYKKNNSKIKI